MLGSDKMVKANNLWNEAQLRVVVEPRDGGGDVCGAVEHDHRGPEVVCCDVVWLGN